MRSHVLLFCCIASGSLATSPAFSYGIMLRSDGNVTLDDRFTTYCEQVVIKTNGLLKEFNLPARSRFRMDISAAGKADSVTFLDQNLSKLQQNNTTQTLGVTSFGLIPGVADGDLEITIDTSELGESSPRCDGSAYLVGGQFTCAGSIPGAGKATVTEPDDPLKSLTQQLNSAINEFMSPTRAHFDGDARAILDCLDNLPNQRDDLSARRAACAMDELSQLMIVRDLSDSHKEFLVNAWGLVAQKFAVFMPQITFLTFGTGISNDELRARIIERMIAVDAKNSASNPVVLKNFLHTLAGIQSRKKDYEALIYTTKQIIQVDETAGCSDLIKATDNLALLKSLIQCNRVKPADEQWTTVKPLLSHLPHDVDTNRTLLFALSDVATACLENHMLDRATPLLEEAIKRWNSNSLDYSAAHSLDSLITHVVRIGRASSDPERYVAFIESAINASETQSGKDNELATQWRFALANLLLWSSARSGVAKDRSEELFERSCANFGCAIEVARLAKTGVLPDWSVTDRQVAERIALLKQFGHDTEAAKLELIPKKQNP